MPARLRLARASAWERSHPRREQSHPAYTEPLAPVAQLDRAPPSGGGGRRFESCRARYSLGGFFPDVREQVAPERGQPPATAGRIVTSSPSFTAVSRPSWKRMSSPET